MTRQEPPANSPRSFAAALRRSGLFFLLLLGGGAAIALAQSPRAIEPTPVAELSHLGTRDGVIRFRARFREPGEVTVEIDGVAHRYPTWPGLFPVGSPGDPAVPAEVVRVAVPTGGPLSLQVATVEGGLLRDVRFPAVPGIANDTGSEEPRAIALAQVELLDVGFDRGIRVADIAVRPVSWDPASGTTAWASEVDVTVSVAGAAGPQAGVRPAAPDEATRRSWSRTLVNPTDAAAFVVAAPDTVPPPGNGIPAVWFENADAWLKIEIEANGVYALDRTALTAIGVPVDDIDPRTWRLFSGPLVPEVAWAALGWDSVATVVPDSVRLESGWRHVYERPGFVNGFGDPGGMEEIAIRVTGETDGSIDAGDRVIFYALGPDNYRDRFGLALDTPEDFFENPYTARTVYWLGWGGTFPDAARRMEILDATPQPAAPLATEATARAHGERNRIYSPTHQDPGLRWEQWFWEEMTSLAAGYIFRVPLPGVVAGSTLDFHLRLWGVGEPLEDAIDLEALHHVQVTVNDQDLGVTQWGSELDVREAFTAQDVVGSGIPVLDPAEFVFRLPDVPPFDPDRVDRVYLAWIDATYRRSLDLGGNVGELPLDAGNPGRRARITSLPPGSGLEILDVTDFRNPRLLTGAATAGTELELSFDRPGNAVLAVTVSDSLRAPAQVGSDDFPHRRPGDTTVAWLREITDPLDYVILAYDDFGNEAEILAAWRRDHLYAVTPAREARVRVVRLSDVMDEFAWGMTDPTAIRYFLEYAYRFYGLPEDDRLAYCLFLGDHNYDFRNHASTGNPVRVPSWEDTRDPSANPVEGNVQHASDDPLARFDGRDSITGELDPFTDLYLGRITATSKAEATRALTRIVTAETNPLYGPWRARAILVADDLCLQGAPDALGRQFLDQIEILDGLYPPAFDRRKLYLVDYGESCSISSKPEAQDDLLGLWNEGAWLVNYVGHGSEFAWADEQVLTRNVLPDLTNESRLPVVIATASKTGWFNRPSSQGLAESLLLQVSGGALAATGSGSDFTFANPAFATNRAFAQLLFPGGDPSRPVPVGVAFLEAKKPRGNDNTKYHFFGDPAMLPPVPETALTVSAPDSLGRGLRVEVGVRIEGGAERSGLASLRAEDARVYRPVGTTGFLRPGERMFEGEASVTADTARASFVVPAAAVGGADARIRAYAWGTDWDALGSRFPLLLGGIPDPAGDTEGPAVTFPAPSLVAAPGDEVEATLEDPSGIKVTGSDPPPLELVVTGAGGAEATRVPLTDRFAYERDSSTRGQIRVPVPAELEDGPYVFTVSAFDNFDNRAQASLDVTVNAAGGPLRIQNVYAYPNPNSFASEPTLVFFTLDRATRLDLRLYTVRGRLVLENSVDGDAGQNIWRWNGRDAVNDDVANGVYLLQLRGPGEGGDAPKVLERLVVLR